MRGALGPLGASMSSEWDPLEHDVGDGAAVVATLEPAAFASWRGWVSGGGGGSSTRGEMYGDCSADTNADDGGDGE